MPDLLFTQFADPSNLRQAFCYVKKEIEKSTLPLDPFWVPGMKAVDVLGDAFFNSLRRLLVEETYEPEQALFFHQHKESYGIRHLAMLTVVDRIVYQALLNPKIMGTQIAQVLGNRCMYPGVANRDDVYLEPYQSRYDEYWSSQKTYYVSQGMGIRGEYDIHAFFDNIRHDMLFVQLEQQNIGSIKLRQLLNYMLSTWHTRGIGLPQGPDVSSVLANFYLCSIDEYIATLQQVGYVRYMDDMSILAQDKRTLLRSVEALSEHLDDLGLALNRKSVTETIHDISYFDDKGKFATYAAEDTDGSKKYLSTAQYMAPDVIQKLYLDQAPTRHEMSSLKYYLKCAEEQSLVADVLALYPELPSFADAIAKYVQPIIFRSAVQIRILKLLSEQHLFRWQMLWLVKLILIGKSQALTRLIEIDFTNSSYWEQKAMAWMTQAMVDPSKIKTADLLRLVDQSTSVFELGIYVGICSYLSPQDVIIKKLMHLSSHPSLEIQCLVAAQMLSKADLATCTIDASLFTYKPAEYGGQIGTKLFADVVPNALGLGYNTHVDNNRRCFLQLKLVGNDIIMTGTLLNGVCISAFSSSKSATFKFFCTLLRMHMKFSPDYLHDYPLSDIQRVHKSSSKKYDEIAKITPLIDKECMSDLCKLTIDVFACEGTKSISSSVERIVSFQSALSEDTFNSLAESKKTRIRKAVSKIPEIQKG